MSKYRVYPDYKPTNIEILGKIPYNWSTIRLKHMAKVKNGQDYKHVEVVDDNSGYPVIGSGGPFTKASIPMFTGESVLLGRKGTIDKPLYINGSFWTVDTMFYTEIKKNTSPKYLYYSSLTIPFDFYSTNTAVPSMTQDDLGSNFFAFPSFDEQNQIANFLDYETAKIDTLIDKQQQLIKLLKEKRQAVISHAVTKGLNPDAPMKGSGVEWLGEVPAHWDVSRIKHHTSIFEQGWSPQCDSRPADDNEYGVLKVGCVNNGVFSPMENKALPAELMPQLQYLIQQGDLLISRANTKELVGSAAVVEGSYSNLILCDKLYRLRFDQNMNVQFISYYLALAIVRQQIELGATGASHSMQNIGQSTIKELPVLVPPIAEANALIEKLKMKANQLDDILLKSEISITLLKERRTALISAAVTGKIDVRNWQPENPQPSTEANA